MFSLLAPLLYILQFEILCGLCIEVFTISSWRWGSESVDY